MAALEFKRKKDTNKEQEAQKYKCTLNEEREKEKVDMKNNKEKGMP